MNTNVNVALSFGSVIVEPRKHPAFEFVVQNVLSRTPIGSPMVIVHGITNGPWIRQKLESALTADDYARLSFQSCGKANLTGKDYNRLLKSASFWTALPFSKILVFQTDSIILSENRDEIVRYFPYAYVGAPWRSGKVGNGGFSLRDKAYCLEVIRHKKRDPRNVNEDVYFSSFMYNSNSQHKPTPTSVAQEFSIETTFHPNPFAVHNCWKYLSTQQWSKLCQAHPELVQLRQLQTVCSPNRPVVIATRVKAGGSRRNCRGKVRVRKR